VDERKIVVPDAVKDLLVPHLEGAVFNTDGINAVILEAYRRGMGEIDPTIGAPIGTME
jgi:hypothetical protein